jgi:hypothetical protein
MAKKKKKKKERDRFEIWASVSEQPTSVSQKLGCLKRLIQLLSILGALIIIRAFF